MNTQSINDTAILTLHTHLIPFTLNPPSLPFIHLHQDVDMLRLCVAKKRPPISEKNKGKIPHGLYVRDIAEVRPGTLSNDFVKNFHRPADEDACFSIIGSESTLSLELPNKFTRDWFLERILLIADDVKSPEERTAIEMRRWGPNPRMNPADIGVAKHVMGLLMRGIQVIIHHASSRVVRGVLSYDQNYHTVVATPTERSLFGFGLASAQSLSVHDIADIRPGCHSLSFVRTKCNKTELCLSLIGTEGTLNFQFTSEDARNTFASKMRLFLQYMQTFLEDSQYQKSLLKRQPIL